MRLSEKSVELNICAQITGAVNQRILWFGLTQAQEAQAGFDAATRLGGRVILFQFKASNMTMAGTKARRFYLEHDQLQTLINQANNKPDRSVYYVFPLIGNTQELQLHKGNFLRNTVLLDVTQLPNPFPPPTINTKPAQLRKNRTHYADVLPTRLIQIHSDPVEAKLILLQDFLNEEFNQPFMMNEEGIEYQVLNKEILLRKNRLRYNSGLKMAVVI